MTQNLAMEWEWKVYCKFGRRYRILVASGYSKDGDRKVYKGSIRKVHAAGGLAIIWVKANSKVANEAARNINNDETLVFGVKPVWRSINEYESICRCRRMTRAEIVTRLSQMSPQDQWEPAFKALCDRYGVKRTHKYAYRPAETLDRSTTRRRRKSSKIRIA